jgi:tRNA (adenine57-N1/adenine58-N1)-methyltransferase
VDAGTGSAFLSIFLANYIRPGKVVTYENEKRFVKTARQNIKDSGLSKFIVMRQKDITRGIMEKNVDLITLDMKDSEKVVRHACRALSPGGYLVVYSPYIEQVTKVVKEMERKGFSNIKTVENIVREWQVEKYTRPKTVGLMHTGFITFARKMI